MKFKTLFSLLFALLFLLCCKKDTLPVFSNSSLTVVNASFENPIFAVTISDTLIPFYRNQSQIYYQSFGEYGYSSGNFPLIIVSASDTTKPLFKANFNLVEQGIYSLFLAGNSKSLDTVFVQEHFTNYDDSLAGVRFINLATGSGPISVNLMGNDPVQKEFSDLGYKQISAFKTYSTSGGIYSYDFEIRDQVSGDLLTTFTWYFTNFKNQTLVISGASDPAIGSPISVFQVNNF